MKTFASLAKIPATQLNDVFLYSKQTIHQYMSPNFLSKYEHRFTPHVTDLKPNEIFVFGSDIEGWHYEGAAYLAYKRFGAVMGQGVGLQGQSYAIPTMAKEAGSIKPFVDEFIDFARNHPELTFFVTRIGCGLAGFKSEQIAPFFADAISIENVYLPKDFWIDLFNPYF